MLIYPCSKVHGQVTDYSYDTLNRLNATQGLNWNNSFVTDAAGNLQSRSYTAPTSAVNGQCGAAHNAATTTKPTAFLCAAGTPSALNGFAWSCQGINGGTTATGCRSSLVYDGTTCFGVIPQGQTTLPAGGSAQFVGECNSPLATTRVWWLDGVRITACDGVSFCTVTFPNPGLRVLTVATSATAPPERRASQLVTVTAPAACSGITGANNVTVGQPTPYSAVCTNAATTLVWKLNGVQVTACDNLVTCGLTFSTLGAQTITVAPTASASAGDTGTLSVNVSSAAASCSEITGPATATASGGNLSYSAVCSNVTGYVWRLDGSLLACNTSTCVVSIPANGTPVQASRTLTVAPSTAIGASATLAIVQAPAAVAPQCSGTVIGQASYPYSGGSSAYSVTCTGATSISWVLAGIAQSCAGANCQVVVPANTTTGPINLSLAVNATNLYGSTGLPPLVVAVAAAPACSLDFNGDGVVNTMDALLFSRWLLGFRGDGLVAGVTPFPVGTSASAFAAAVAGRMVITSVHDFDNNTSIDAATDGLLFLRLTQGLRDPALTAGALGPGAQRTTYDVIRTHINANCGTNYPQ